MNLLHIQMGPPCQNKECYDYLYDFLNILPVSFACNTLFNWESVRSLIIDALFFLKNSTCPHWLHRLNGLSILLCSSQLFLSRVSVVLHKLSASVSERGSLCSALILFKKKIHKWEKYMARHDGPSFLELFEDVFNLFVKQGKKSALLWKMMLLKWMNYQHAFKKMGVKVYDSPFNH